MTQHFPRLRHALALSAPLPACVLAVSLLPAAAIAQSSSVEQQASGADPDDIVVTARKRQESALKVPVVETILSQDMIERTAISDIADVATRVPGLGVGDSVLTVGTQISLRGVGTSTLDAGVDQSVSLNIDGLQLTQGTAYRSGVFDVAQIEVLKGPQALFFGKNSPGGVIAIRTADPGSSPEMMMRLGYEFESRSLQPEFVLSGPVTDTLGLRIAARYTAKEGYFRNTAIAIPATGAAAPQNEREGQGHSVIVRGTALWEPSAVFDVRLKLNYTEDRNYELGPPQLVSCPDGIAPVTLAPGFTLPPFIQECDRNRDNPIVNVDPLAFPGVRNGGQPFLFTTQYFGTLEMSWRPWEEWTLTSTTGAYHNDTDAMINGTSATLSAPAIIADNEFSREEFTQELRLESDMGDSELNMLFGGFLQDANMKNLINVGGNTFLGLPAIAARGSHDLDIQSYSLFGQLRWQAADTLEIAAGVRWTDERRTDDPTRYDFATGELVPVLIADPEISASNWSPELSITFTPTDDLTIFGSLKQGYKSGSFEITTPAGDGDDNSFGDEKVQGGEIGVKTRLANRQISFNAAGYYYKYSGLQVGANDVADNGIPVVTTLNAGKATVYGIEMDVNWRPDAVPGLNAYAAANWNHARFDELEGAPCYGGQTIAQGCDQFLNPQTGLFTAQDLSGVPLVRAPDWQANAGVDYEFDISSALALSLGGNLQYSDDYLVDLGPRDDFYQDSFVKLGANVALKGVDDSWEIALIGNNLTDELTTGNCINFSAQSGQVFGGVITGGTGVGPAGVDEVGCYLSPGREIWLRGTVRF